MVDLNIYLTELTNIFNECHSRLLDVKTEKDIHKLRTTLKKLRTFNILLDRLLSKKRDFPKEFFLLFKSVGEIRDIQIQQKVLEGYEDKYKDYLIYLHDHKVSNLHIKNSFIEEIGYLNNKLHKLNEKNDENRISDRIMSYTEELKDDIKSMVNEVSIENLHDIRKKVKRYYYTLLMMFGKTEKSEILDHMQETIGLWHDYDITVQNMIKFGSNQDIIDILGKKRDSFYDESLELIKFFDL